MYYRRRPTRREKFYPTDKTGTIPVRCHANFMSTIALHSTFKKPISEAVRDRGLVPKDHQ